MRQINEVHDAKSESQPSSHEKQHHAELHSIEELFEK
jgi:hypothetical protein